MKEPQLRKVILNLSPEDWHGHSTEIVWGEKVGDKRYRLRSVPFYAKGLSFGDIVNTITRNGSEVVTGVSLRGGHSTYRVFVTAPNSIGSPEFDRVWLPITAYGCTYERASQHLMAIDVPPSADMNEVYALLQSGELTGVWEFEEGHCSHPRNDAH